jgi:hypothetical protein
MAFTYGIHRWEIFTPVVSSLMELGVHNQATGKSFMETSFKESEEINKKDTASKFIITLDLH